MWEGARLKHDDLKAPMFFLPTGGLPKGPPLLENSFFHLFFKRTTTPHFLMMKRTLISLASLSTLALCAPQFEQPWNGFFSGDHYQQKYDQSPYPPPPHLSGPGYGLYGASAYNAPPPPGYPLSLYPRPTERRPVPSQPHPHSAPHQAKSVDQPIYRNPVPLPPPPPQQAVAAPPPSPPHPPPVPAKELKPEEKPKKSLTEKISAAEDATEPLLAASPRPPPPVVVNKKTPKQEQATTSSNGDEKGDDFDESAIRYHVNVGGMQKAGGGSGSGSGGGTTNFHVYTDENGNKRFSDELDPETERYIKEEMIPKLGGGRRKKPGSGVWSVFGDK